MIQVGNFHFGKADSAKQPQLDIVEAGILVQHLYYRYYCIEQTHQYYKAANDSDLKKMIKMGIEYLEKEVTLLEEQMEKHSVPMPSRSPKSIKAPVNVNDSSLINDQMIYEQIRSGCSAAVEKNLRNFLAIINNDSLRSMFTNFVKEEVEILLQCCKYGKMKGWVPVYPPYKPD
ncbi:DUF3231 family protein [Dethiobacter alkaliphilus]|uniref:Coat F domain protein n=1 Tax=Dethiobacter alkaliphilus AHT 1 TaxID=555088 RepID=C0GKU5_DETAL|nr:DUF3231 family protein [Dethiobacter alkaliphilus]EEG76027.1 conserved hypothetical protein [Dethiobacter alkaliphilus AHT 1]